MPNPDRPGAQDEPNRLDVLAEIASQQKRLPVPKKDYDNLALLTKAASKALDQDKSDKVANKKASKSVHGIKSDTGSTETVFPDLPDDDDATIVEFPLEYHHRQRHHRGCGSMGAAAGPNSGSISCSRRDKLVLARRDGTIARLELRNIRAVHAFARDHAIDCDLRPCDTLDVVYDAGEWAAAREGVRGLREAFSGRTMTAAGEGDVGGGEEEDGDRGGGGDGEDGGEGRYTLYSREEVLARFPVHDGVFGGREERVQGGVGYFAGSLSAYKFGIGVLRACVDRGLNLQTGTPVTMLVAASSSATDEKGRWDVNTQRGVVRAGRVVLATNGYTAGVWPRFQGAVVPLRGQVTAHRPGQAMPAGGCLDRTYSFIYERGYEYMVSQPEGSRFPGDIIMGGGLARAQEEGLMEFGRTDDGAVNEEISGYLRDTTGRYFGPDWGEDHPEGRTRSEWTGIMGFSPDGFPFVGEVPGESGLWASCGFQGHGMVLCWECARALVEMMEGRDGEELREWFPDIFRITEQRMAQRFRGRLDAIPKTEKKQLR
ncbi:hypothetical protein CHGG_08866 [Chaetomium globosum CBS 148.51]|uniref:FAD dependent oxidoreductase domain-containing protein n=1 Tax=Chaetomium globosum (strain ATCC 6205 / CBS 148.51 / DSM 1962 / NBRC 6347 / NRRL 1970) TaxID=306901 RepID=Q2GT38_CHAGB|nr:uncharacterized protein CHGG_08866 [Chaetomium globosum CBS 148.51]EAQ84852.1 hypothetical protein CHGG_08866 [Chaetomium globosum CBS 148.51]